MGTISLSIPVAGQPNSSEDAKIASDLTAIQTLLNGNLDTNNLSSSANIAATQIAGGFTFLSAAVASTSLTGAAGQCYYASPSVTVTLPAASAGIAIGIVAAASTTGATAVTVACPGIAVINGEGCGASGAASITLGTPASHVVMLCDGANWLIIGGQRDSGWLTITPGSNVSSSGYYTAAARQQGDRVTFRGTLLTTNSIGSGVTLATVPTSLRPGGTMVMAANVSNLAGTGAGATLTLNTSGVLVNPNGSINSNYYVAIEGLSYTP